MPVRLAAAAALLLLAACGGPAPDPAPGVAADGVRLHVRTVGDGPQTVVLLHGGPGLSLESLAGLDPLAGPERTLVSYDQRGSGRTGPPDDGDLGLSAHAADLEAVREAAGAERVVLVAQSWGGLVAAAYTATHPDRVRGLVLLGAAPPDVTAFEAGQQAFAVRLAELQRRGIVPDPLPSPSAGSCLPPLEAVLPVYAADPASPVVEPAGTTCTAGVSGPTYAAALPALPEVARRLAAYDGPVLVVAGERDPFGPGWPAAWRRVLPQARVLVVPAAGHMPVLEQPDAVLPALRTALEEADRTAYVPGDGRPGRGFRRAAAAHARWVGTRPSRGPGPARW